MIEKKGEVISCEGDFIKVRIYRESSCGENCASCGVCGKKEHVVFVKNPSDAKEGDQVMVFINKKSLQKAAFLTYIFPILMLIAGYYVTYAVSKTEYLSVVVSIVVMLFGFVALHFYDKNAQDKYSLSAKKITKE